MSNKFESGAKVFAKVRGYPPWPARIEGCADETPNKVKYHVYFYGTGETAVIKNQDVFDYVENKMKFGKLKKHKNFSEAITQIESELTAAQKSALATLETNAGPDSPKDKETPSTAKETPSETPKSKDTSDSTETAPATTRRSSTSSNKPKGTPAVVIKPAPKEKRKFESDSTSEEPAAKKHVGNTPASAAETDKPSAEGTSRSGRKIRPKKFTDFDGDNEESSSSKESEKKPKETPKKSTARPKSLKDPVDNSKDSNDSDPGDWYLSATKGKESVKIPINLNRPNFDDKKSRSVSRDEWEDLVLNEARSLKKRYEGGESFTQDKVNDYMDRFTRVKAAEVYVLRSPEEEEAYKVKTYELEYNVLDTECQIREAVALAAANTKSCLKLMEKLKNLPVTALMLKKFPQLVETMRKLRKYVGNTASWNMTVEQADQFEMDAAKIRIKADEIVNNYRNLFFQPTGGSFWDHFANELAAFTAKTEHMSQDEVFAIVAEPE